MKYYHMEISETGRYAFVPAEYGRYIRTHVAVLFVDCPQKLCQAKRNAACISLTKLARFDTRVVQVKICGERLSAYHTYLAEKPNVGPDGHIIKLRGKKHG